MSKIKLLLDVVADMRSLADSIQALADAAVQMMVKKRQNRRKVNCGGVTYRTEDQHRSCESGAWPVIQRGVYRANPWDPAKTRC